MLLSCVQRSARVLSLLLLAMFGTAFLMRAAPGFFSAEREMDARYGAAAQVTVAAQAQQEGSLLHVWASTLQDWVHGTLGISRQYQVPVNELLVPRLRVSGRLLAIALGTGTAGAFLAALWCSGLRSLVAQRAVTLATALVICIPVSALGTFCLLNGRGGPALVLSAAVAARDFRFFSRVLRHARSAPYLQYARACGVSPQRLLVRHLLRPMVPEFASLFAMAGIVALGALIPVEVIFDVPGAGQLAWSAAMNRDLPVLLAVTAMMAICIAGSTFVTHDARLTSESQ